MTTTLDKPDFVLETIIETSPERVWEALTSAELSRKYYIAAAAIHGRIEAGERYEYLTGDGNVMLSGEIIAADPPRRLEMTFVPSWAGPDPKPSRNVYEIDPVGEATRLTILHYDIPAGQDGVKDGWTTIAAGLKALLEAPTA
jgi:uncharacterized protein YndB with AHSA1/START domain